MNGGIVCPQALLLFSCTSFSTVILFVFVYALGIGVSLFQTADVSLDSILNFYRFACVLTGSSELDDHIV